jgi:hypothetical protein
MLEYRLLLASMLLIAFLNSGQAQEAGEMPGELEISLGRAAEQGYGYHISGTIPLQLPDGDDSFIVQAKMRAYWRFISTDRKCRLNLAFIALRIVGRRNHDRLTLKLSLTPEVLRPACSDDKPTETTDQFVVNTGSLNSTEFTLFVADGSNEERTVEDSPQLGKLTGKVTLHLACPVRLVDSESVPVISVLPSEAAPWPLRFDDSKTSEELSALVARPSGVVGLTRPSTPYPPLAFFRIASRPAALRRGFCFSIRSIQVEFTPVEMLLANKYPDESCEYKVIREHEMLHYQDLQNLFVRYQALVIAALRQAGFPTVERPILVESVMVGTSQSKTRLQSTLQPIYASMERDLQADVDARDAPEQRVLSWSKCPNWYARIIGVRHRAASYPPRMDGETMRLAPKKTTSEFSSQPNK